jgi:Aerotolerance regulator N-terminal/von Willebrand factor type A domain
MGFLAPAFLAGLAVVGLPIWLHLLKKHRSVPLPFSSLMFFERRTQSSIKHRRLQYLLLFALRTALVILLALAFAHPFIRTAAAPSAGGHRMLVLALDDSFSMRQGDRLDRAKREATRVASTLRSGDRGQVLAFGSQVRAMSDATDDVNALRSAIQSITAGDERGSFAEISRTLRSLAQAAKLPIEAHVFSDMQKASMPSNFADLRLAEGIELTTHTVADKRVANFAVENVKVPRHSYGAGKVRVQATITGFGTERATRRVSLVLNGREVDSKTVDVPPDSRATAEFLSLEPPFGLNKGEVRIDSGDSFPADDRYLFAIERSEPRNVLFVHDNRHPLALLYFRTALEAGSESEFRLDAAPIDQAANVSFAKYAFVVLSDVAGVTAGFENNLKNYVRGGGSLLIALGRTAAAARRVPVFDESIRDTLYAGREGERFQTAAWLDPAHPSTRESGEWDDVKFYQAVRVEPGKSRVAARLSDETPLLLDKALGEGRVLVFASTFDNVANDFPLHASFVPFIEQTAQYLGRMDNRQANFVVGSYLELRSAREQGATIEVLDPKGERALSLAESTRAQNIRLASSGYYEVHRPSGRRELVAVNPDRLESDLNIIPAETLALWQNTAHKGVSAGESGDAERKPKDFWWYAMLAVLALAVAESLLGNRHLAADQRD